VEAVVAPPRIAARAAPAVAARRVAGGLLRQVALVAAVGVCLFLIAWAPRLAAIDAYLTTDEGNWMGRTGLFTRGTLTGDYLLTRQSGHPGVTTMLTALAGIGPANALYLADYVRPDGLEKAPGYLDLLRQARRPFTVMTSLAVVVISLLVWRLFGAGPGLLAGVLLALEPFFLAHSGVVHLDGMLAAYMTVAYLSGLVYWGAGGGRGYLVLCGLATGLAFLTKTPSALLAVFIPLLALVATRTRGRLATVADWKRLLAEGLTWGVLAGAPAFLLWSSLRADFKGTLEYMVWYTQTVGGGEHENFWRGQPVLEPGPLYYVDAFRFRVSPVTLLGLVLLAVGLLPVGPRRVPRRWVGPLLAIGAFVALFTAMMMLLPKKFDRYLMPTFPSWEILAAVGFWLALWRFGPRWSGRALPLALLAVGLAQFWGALQVFPYYMAYYNPLFGGGRVAAKHVVVGWGEGLDLVTRYLNTKPDAERLTLAGFYPRVLMAQFKGGVLPDKQFDPAEADYIVLYVNAVQRDLANTLRTAVRGRRAEQIVTINGIEYARLFRVPPPPGRSPAGTEFGPLRLDRAFLRSEERRYMKSDNLHAGDTLYLTLRWTLLRPVDSVYHATFALLDRQGRTVAQTTGQVGGPDESTLTVQPGAFVTELHTLPLAADLPPGEYTLAVGVRPAPGAPAEAVTAWPEKLAQSARLGADRVAVETIQVSPPEDE
jgi:hypothetical protein